MNFLMTLLYIILLLTAFAFLAIGKPAYAIAVALLAGQFHPKYKDLP